MLTSEELYELKRLEREATQGQWLVVPQGGDNPNKIPLCIGAAREKKHEWERDYDCLINAWMARDEDLAFIVAIRNAAPKLLRLIDDYEEERMLLRGQVRTLEILSSKSQEAYRLEIGRLKKLVEDLVARCAGQSELIAQRAERKDS